MARLIKGVHHIALKANSLEKYNELVHFYRDLLGMEEVRGWGEGEASGIMLYNGNSVMELMCGAQGFSQEKTREKVAALTREFNLESLHNKRAGKLSGGWQRRLSIAMALIGEPEILFLDEPTLGLDVIARSELWDTIRSLKGKITMVLTTHYMEEAEALSDRIGIMKEVRLIALGTAEELKLQAGKERFEEAFVAIVKGVQQ